MRLQQRNKVRKNERHTMKSSRVALSEQRDKTGTKVVGCHTTLYKLSCVPCLPLVFPLPVYRVPDTSLWYWGVPSASVPSFCVPSASVACLMNMAGKRKALKGTRERHFSCVPSASVSSFCVPLFCLSLEPLSAFLLCSLCQCSLFLCSPFLCSLFLCSLFLCSLFLCSLFCVPSTSVPSTRYWVMVLGGVLIQRISNFLNSVSASGALEKRPMSTRN